VNIIAYIPVACHGDPKIHDLTNNQGILLAADHISPLADQANLKLIISENAAQILELQNQIRVPPQAPLSTGTMPENWQMIINRLEQKFDEAEKARAIAEEERAYAYAEAVRAQEERDGIISNLIKEYSTPFNKILLGGLIYMARDRITDAYRQACITNYELEYLQNDQDIFSENYAGWVSHYLQEKSNLDFQKMQELMNSKLKHSRDDVAYHPSAKQVGAAIQTIRGEQKRELLTSLFHFVFPNEKMDWINK